MRCPAWQVRELPPLAEVTDATLQAEEVNARNIATDSAAGGPGFAIPWDLHPRSLHAEFAHNTDLLLTLGSSAVRRGREVGVGPSTPFGLGGGMCVHVRRDGTAAELIGRLCVPAGADADRNASIARAAAVAEAERPLRHSRAWHSYVHRESKQWRLEGTRGSGKERTLVRVVTRGRAEAQRRGGGRGRGRRGRGRRGRARAADA